MLSFFKVTVPSNLKVQDLSFHGFCYIERQHYKALSLDLTLLLPLSPGEQCPVDGPFSEQVLNLLLATVVSFSDHMAFLFTATTQHLDRDSGTMWPLQSISYTSWLDICTYDKSLCVALPYRHMESILGHAS